MTVPFARLFIKDYKNFTNTAVRRAYGILCSVTGIFLNLILFSGKLVAGILARSVAMEADAFNNLSDAASSIISLLGFKLSGKKPDADHPFGHGRLEYISGLAISFLILIMGLELGKSSVSAILNSEKIESGIFQIIVLAGSILIKLYMYLYNHGTGKKINSPTMEAVAKDSLSDMISTGVVVLSLILSPFTSLPVDGIGGIIVAFFIIKTGIESAKETIDPLLGLPPEKEFVEAVQEAVLAHKPIIGIHDMIVHDYGPGRLFLTLHAEVPGNENIFDLHEIIDETEVDIAIKFNCLCTIHLDPIETENERLKELKQVARDVAEKIDENISIHDVRMVPGERHTNLIFDAVRPHDCKLSKEELKKELAVRIHEIENDVYCVVTIDDPYVN
ncbi:MAG: cation diffusion facilitator family transporter [Treponema sp.]|nr:cation diffusion facilitator family transporter [Treponema sp.]